ncbi:MAG: hypothetical protein Q7T28_08560 [Cypionkella sp.]|uniref:hypothetical protein n=1 Tax=Cypionkella sp. TaxID=2811411 RepID=UPI00271AA207|nr:hypothetical protein [Cypionkella sp.]MDO8326980.1 hypothetical protein [Cypionkella sp.]
MILQRRDQRSAIIRAKTRLCCRVLKADLTVGVCGETRCGVQPNQSRQPRLISKIGALHKPARTALQRQQRDKGHARDRRNQLPNPLIQHSDGCKAANRPDQQHLPAI